MLYSLVFAAIYFVLFALYINPNANYESFSLWDSWFQPVILILSATLIIYVHAHARNKMMGIWARVLLYIPAVLQGVASMTMYYVLGLDKAAMFTKLCDEAQHAAHGFIADVFSMLPPEYCGDEYRMFFRFTVMSTHILSAIYVALIFAMCFYVLRKRNFRWRKLYMFAFKGKAIDANIVVCLFMIVNLMFLVPMVALGRTVVYHHPFLGMSMSIGLAVALFCMCHAEYMSELPAFTKKNLLNVNPYQPYTPVEQRKHRFSAPTAPASSALSEQKEPEITSYPEKNPSDITPEGQPENPKETVLTPQKIVADGQEETANSQNTTPDTQIVTDATQQNAMETAQTPEEMPKDATSYRVKLFKIRLEKLLNEDKVYLDPNISIVALANKMDSNRTTLSSYVNQNYGVSFRELINKYRVDYAKAYMLEHPTYTQLQVALESGYKDASAFCHKFKDAEGCTPNVWLMQQMTQQQPSTSPEGGE